MEYYKVEGETREYFGIVVGAKSRKEARDKVYVYENGDVLDMDIRRLERGEIKEEKEMNQVIE